MSSDNIVIRVLIVASQWSTHKTGRNNFSFPGLNSEQTLLDWGTRHESGLTQQPFVSDNLQITILQAAVQALSRLSTWACSAFPYLSGRALNLGLRGASRLTSGIRTSPPPLPRENTLARLRNPHTVAIPGTGLTGNFEPRE